MVFNDIHDQSIHLTLSMLNLSPPVQTPLYVGMSYAQRFTSNPYTIFLIELSKMQEFAPHPSNKLVITLPIK